MGVAVQFVLSMLIVLWMDIHRGCYCDDLDIWLILALYHFWHDECAWRY